MLTKETLVFLTCLGLAGGGCGHEDSVGFLTNGDSDFLNFEAFKAVDGDVLFVRIARTECFEGCGGFGDCAEYCRDTVDLDWGKAVVELDPEPATVTSEVGARDNQSFAGDEVSGLNIEATSVVAPMRIDVRVAGKQDSWIYTGE
ncbi:MAG: hypothetical protein A2289_20595 [Deltaproteobacteria bacterium RIFOXYA12_FULL_58_15]|nr:MAG: hypothetical protein A2289_20595 [Deltaproteobacteria bacterium RIFOXYA12_FULL_58_15]OGR10169.1 MAG: hypothetical protein A2341_06035 [Deltaproteobacteria bacterium RIFOXYB12_FULL_58_9]